MMVQRLGWSGEGERAWERWGLSEEAVLHLISFLDARSLASLSSTSRAFLRISSDDLLWKEQVRRCSRRHVMPLALRLHNRAQGKFKWKEIYKRLFLHHKWADGSAQAVIMNDRKTATINTSHPNTTVHCGMPIEPEEFGFQYFQVHIDHKAMMPNLVFGVTGGGWRTENDFLGYEGDSFNLGTTSDGRAKLWDGKSAHYGLTKWGTGDTVALWVERHSGGDEPIDIFCFLRAPFSRVAHMEEESSGVNLNSAWTSTATEGAGGIWVVDEDTTRNNRETVVAPEPAPTTDLHEASETRWAWVLQYYWLGLKPHPTVVTSERWFRFLLHTMPTQVSFEWT